MIGIKIRFDRCDTVDFVYIFSRNLDAISTAHPICIVLTTVYTRYWNLVYERG